MEQNQNFNPLINNFYNFNNMNPFLNNANSFNVQNNFLHNINQMNFGNQMIMNNNPLMMQMNMNANMPIDKNSDVDFIDFYNYINEKKKKVVFLRVLDNKSFNLLIPCSLRKNELYLTAQFYKKFECSEIQLFHNEKFLNDDETSIDCINEKDEVKIIEQLHGVDFSYYDSYLSRHKNEELCNVILFIVWKEKRRTFHFTLNTSIEEMIKIFYDELYIPENNKDIYYFLFNSYKLNPLDKSTLKQNSFKEGITVEIHKSLNWGFRYGKGLEAIIKDKNKIIGKRPAGTLQTINNLYLDIDNNMFNCNNLSLKNIKINGKEISKNDKRTLSSIGIRDNFICSIELNKNQ